MQCLVFVSLIFESTSQDIWGYCKTRNGRNSLASSECNLSPEVILVIALLREITFSPLVNWQQSRTVLSRPLERSSCHTSGSLGSSGVRPPQDWWWGALEIAVHCGGGTRQWHHKAMWWYMRTQTREATTLTQAARGRGALSELLMTSGDQVYHVGKNSGSFYLPASERGQRMNVLCASVMCDWFSSMYKTYAM